MINQEESSFDAETRLITLDQLRLLQKRAHHLIDQLTVISGYCQVAMDADVEPTVQFHLEKIFASVAKAAQSVQYCLALVNDTERSGGFEGRG